MPHRRRYRAHMALPVPVAAATITPEDATGSADLKHFKKQLYGKVKQEEIPCVA